MIERSSDSELWTDLIKVAGAGNSTITHFYEHIDEDPLNGQSYYRLRQVDHDGVSDRSEIRSVFIEGATDASMAVMVYPNPSQGSVFVRITGSDGEVSLDVRNAMGQAVRTLRTYAGEVTEMRGLASGVYFLDVRFATGFTTMRFVVTE